MDISLLDKHLVTDTLVVGGEGCAITFDANKFTGELGRRMAKTYRTCAARIESQAKAHGKKRAKKQETVVSIAEDLASSMELNAALDDLDREIYADALAADRYGILEAWGLTDKGKALAPTFDVLMKRSAPVLKLILNFCRDAALPKKTTTTESLTTAETINDGSSPPITPLPESPVM